MKRLLALALAGALVVIAIALLRSGPPPGRRDGPPDEGPLHQRYEQLLEKYLAADGTINYQRWHDSPEDLAQLEQYLARLAHSSPDEHPALFASAGDQQGYWVNLYNALVIREILNRWPMSSVKQRTRADGGTQGPEAFFQEVRFEAGGRKLSLDQIEGRIIRDSATDPRFYFALNCGARSCPSLKPRAFVGLQLSEQLDAASRAFINDPKHVAVNDEGRTLTLSSIFKWYQSDFEAFAGTHREEGDLIGFLMLFAEGDLKSALRRARTNRYQVTFQEYDWQVNATLEPSTDAHVGQPMPPDSWQLLDGGSWRPSDDLGRVVIVDFWATYCVPCRTSFPRLEELSRRHRQEGLVVVGIAVEPQSEAIGAFLGSTGATFAIALDPEGNSARPPLEVTSLPTQLMIDRRGVIRFRHEGVSSDALDTAREAKLLLSEPR